jgi:hypothetical protein
MPRKQFDAFTRLDASDVNTFLMDQSVMTFATSAARGSAIATPVEGMTTFIQSTDSLEVYNGTAFVSVGAGGVANFRFVQTVRFNSSGTFTKATYPWLRAIKVMAIGGGGAGVGATATNASQCSGGGGGGGGGYAESFITDIAGLASSVTVTVGAGGTGVTGTGVANNGGQSNFGGITVAGGGEGGRDGSTGNFSGVFGTGGAGGNALNGDYGTTGGAGGIFFATANDRVPTGSSGSSRFAGNARTGINIGTGNNGLTPGGGGTSAANAVNSSAVAGGSGGAGIVIVELYA